MTKPTATTAAADPASTALDKGGVSALVSAQGSTTIADTVVSKVAGLATREVSGVYALGSGAARAFGAIRERIPGASASVSQGVSVEVGERQAAIDLQILVDYGVSITDLSRSVRRNVITAVEQITGLEVVEVNINVSDVHLPGDNEDGAEDGAGAGAGNAKADTGRVR
ncbi:Asp23/Gls24 family envelope stress response protein [Amycolatopsis sp. A133]|uniref:Asp23/Gls24 family envelope stress response protein n=1 Tax=Amycolatopsis sp. A133 TaxID=3064472 RepID=UPI0027EBC610|nr:Asp23/Gls24 family envelope stress response protein [Amycolatopsis sp. A133]MDQ7810831.1 Asp23/Gls24 family envelope stress response protein [Amycolatopsis sp. A133]